MVTEEEDSYDFLAFSQLDLKVMITLINALDDDTPIIFSS